MGNKLKNKKQKKIIVLSITFLLKKVRKEVWFPYRIRIQIKIKWIHNTALTFFISSVLLFGKLNFSCSVFPMTLFSTNEIEIYAPSNQSPFLMPRFQLRAKWQTNKLLTVLTFFRGYIFPNHLLLCGIIWYAQGNFLILSTFYYSCQISYYILH